MRDDEITKVPCLVCKGRGRSSYVPCEACVGAGMVTPDEQARQRLTWPKEKRDDSYAEGVWYDAQGKEIGRGRLF